MPSSSHLYFSEAGIFFAFIFFWGPLLCILHFRGRHLLSIYTFWRSSSLLLYVSEAPFFAFILFGGPLLRIYTFRRPPSLLLYVSEAGLFFAFILFRVPLFWF
jgi:hypothetical protein